MKIWAFKLIALVQECIDAYLGYGFEHELNPTETRILKWLLDMSGSSGVRVEIRVDDDLLVLGPNQEYFFLSDEEGAPWRFRFGQNPKAEDVITEKLRLVMPNLSSDDVSSVDPICAASMYLL